MSGEYKTAQTLIENALAEADNSANSSADALSQALLGVLLQSMAKQRGIADLKSFIDFQLENLDTDEIVVTRGC
ncbi:hypothetical protein [uncultured Pseudoteredinibacter sp.]|uniref:hypothetical protein n=1 Tax=uncultured Pseudoteredinibacter sp. TaxID=1641701 RepID=UPI00260AC442|nr:hypothetical protein [uncultured Pseudoteredinibacter sp.]